MRPEQLNPLLERFKKLPLQDQKQYVKVLQLLERDGLIGPPVSQQFLALLESEASETQ